MNGNSSKQVLLSVLGIAILVVAVVGVSFAFFSYTKTGSTTNTIATGEIYTYMNTVSTMELSNAMPVQTTPTTFVDTTTGDVGALSFTVTGKNQSDKAITYKIYLVSPGDVPSGKTKFADSDIGVMMKATGGEGKSTDLAATNVQTIGGLGQALLGTGTIAANTNADVTHTYLVNMWVKGDTVKISDTDTSVNGVETKYCAHEKVLNPETTTATGNHGCEINKPLYSTMYYHAKIRVVANTDANNTGVNYNGGAAPTQQDPQQP